MKRFTDTDKWLDPWFRKLTAGMKLAFLFIVDNCDPAGVWDPDTEMADILIGVNVPWDKVLAALGDRCEVLPDGKWYLTRFIKFQYGELSATCRPHLKVFEALNKHGINYCEHQMTVKRLRPLRQPTEKNEPKNGHDLGSCNRVSTATRNRVSAKRGKGIADEGIGPVFEAFWLAYPRKVGKGKAEEAWVKHGCERIAAKIMGTLQKMKTSPDWKKDNGEFIPYPASWLNRKGWEDEPQLALAINGNPTHENPAGWIDWLKLKGHDKPEWREYRYAPSFLKSDFGKWEKEKNL